MITLVPGSIVTGILVTRYRNYVYPIRTGWLLTTAASGLTIILDDTTHPAVWVITLIILGLGHGAILNAQNFATQTLCDDGQEGSAASTYAFLRQFGMAISVGIGGSVFQNTMATKLERDGLTSDIAAQSESFITEISRLPESDPLKPQVINAYLFGLRNVYILYTAISGGALLLSFLIEQRDMTKEIRTNHRLRTSQFNE